MRRVSQLSATHFKNAYLFPLGTSSQKSDQNRGDPQTFSDLCGMVNELVCAKLEHKQAPNEGGDVKGDVIVVDHVEKSVIAWRSVERRREHEVL